MSAYTSASIYAHIVIAKKVLVYEKHFYVIVILHMTKCQERFCQAKK